MNKRTNRSSCRFPVLITGLSQQTDVSLFLFTLSLLVSITTNTDQLCPPRDITSEEAAEDQLCRFISIITMPRLVRRRPLAERIGSYLNPWDFLLWLSEEIEGNDWDQLEKDWGTAIGIALNAIFLIARANSQSSGSRAIDDVFGEESGVAWGSWLVSSRAVISSRQDYMKLTRNSIRIGLDYHFMSNFDFVRQCYLHLSQNKIISLV